MPYLTYDRKEEMLEKMNPSNAGELNFLITVMCLRYWNNSKQNYEAINSIVGAVESAKLEFYRRVATVYENTKIVANGDVYEGVIG